MASLVAAGLAPGGMVDPSLISAGQSDDLSVSSVPSRCAHPVLLAGSRSVVERSTGLLLHTFSSAESPDGAISVRCGNRRASVCPSCSRLYRFDAYRVVAAGLRGGESVPDSVSVSPRLFVTLTAPSFGPVHLGPAKDGTLRACHRSGHGSGRCGRFHRAGDELVGTPLDPGSYDYAGQVLFNACAGALWSRFVLEARRALAEYGGLPRAELGRHLAISFAKVAEFQGRGVVHFHAVVRLDGPNGAGSAPPSWADTTALAEAVSQASVRASVRTPDSGPCPSRVLRFGVQVDVRRVGGAGSSSLSDGAVARYVAKYATKSTESAGLELSPLACRSCAGRGRVEVDEADVPERFCPRCHGHGRRDGVSWLDDPGLSAHARRLVETCWQLGGLPGLEALKLRRWAHMLGFRGHFATKSRSYSVTFTLLRERRAQFTALLAHAALGLPVGADSVLVVNDWRYAGRGIAEVPGTPSASSPPDSRPAGPVYLGDGVAAGG
jgi:hypothetical protein